MLREPAQLVIDYLPHHEVIQANPNRAYFFDREFVSNGQDRSISRRPHCPCLRYRAGSWWIDNDSDTTEAKLQIWIKAEKRKHEIPRRCSFALPDGEVEVRVWNVAKYPVALLTISGSDPAQTRPVPTEHLVYDSDNAITQPGLPDSDLRVVALFDEDPMVARQLVAYYREYFVSSPEDAEPLSREEVGRCFGKSAHMIDSALRKVQRAIWGTGGGHTDEIPSYLINRGLLDPGLEALVPHYECGHKRTSTGRIEDSAMNETTQPAE
ncbi:MAG: hypothetical protein AB7I38_11985 [Dehalococcoidia bacterium]